MRFERIWLRVRFFFLCKYQTCDVIALAATVLRCKAKELLAGLLIRDAVIAAQLD